MPKIEAEFTLTVEYFLEEVGTQEENNSAVELAINRILNLGTTQTSTGHLVAYKLTLKKRGLQLIEVESSNINAIGYLAESAILEIQFKGGGRYHYFSVPSEVYEAFMSSESKGKYFFRCIKNKYHCQKVV